MYYDIGDDQQIYYETFGNIEKPNLVLLHGNGETFHIFDGFIKKMQDDFYIYALDLPGHGKSSKVSEYHYNEMMEAVAKLVLDLKIAKPILLGFSDGGIIGLLLAIEYQSMLEKLIVCSANVNTGGFSNISNFFMKIVYFFTRNPKYKMMLSEPNISKEQLQMISVKTLVVAGSNDLVQRGHTIKIHEDIYDSLINIIPNANHFSYIKQGDTLVSLVKDFIFNI